MDDDPRLISTRIEVTVAHGLLKHTSGWMRRRELFRELHDIEARNPILRFDERGADRALERLVSAGILEGEHVADADTVFSRIRFADGGTERLRALLDEGRRRWERHELT